MSVDLLVAKYIMACNYSIVIITLIITTIRIKKLPIDVRIKQTYLTLPSIIWCVHAFVFYSYTFFIKQYWDPIPDNDIYYFAWGASIILHAAFNYLGIELTRLNLDGH